MRYTRRLAEQWCSSRRKARLSPIHSLCGNSYKFQLHCPSSAISFSHTALYLHMAATCVQAYMGTLTVCDCASENEDCHEGFLFMSGIALRLSFYFSWQIFEQLYRSTGKSACSLRLASNEFAELPNFSQSSRHISSFVVVSLFIY